MNGAGIILINRKDEILLLLRDDNILIPYPNKWDIPGGMMEKGESPEETIRREMKEELGLQDLGEIKLFKVLKSENLIDYIFWKRLDLIPDEIDLKEGQRIEYFDINRIRNTKLAFNYNFVIEEFFREIVENV